MPRPRRNRSAARQVETLRHEQYTRTNIIEVGLAQLVGMYSLTGVH